MRKKKVTDAGEPTHLSDAARRHAGPGQANNGGKDAQSIGDWQPPAQDPAWAAEGSMSRTEASQSVSRRSSVALDGHIASADLLNPSDALDLLAHVADLDPSGQDKNSASQRDRNAQRDSTTSSVQYPPITNGALAYADAASLLQQ